MIEADSMRFGTVDEHRGSWILNQGDPCFFNQFARDTQVCKSVISGYLDLIKFDTGYLVFNLLEKLPVYPFVIWVFWKITPLEIMTDWYSIFQFGELELDYYLSGIIKACNCGRANVTVSFCLFGVFELTSGTNLPRMMAVSILIRLQRNEDHELE